MGCPVGLEPTVSRSTIWRVNRLRYGHHIDAPEGTRTPGPLLRRQLLYPPELRAHVVIPWVPLWRQLCVGTRCEKYNTIRNPVCQEQFEKSFGFLCGAVTAATCRQSRRQTRGQARRPHPGYGARRSVCFCPQGKKVETFFRFSLTECDGYGIISLAACADTELPP